MCFVLIFERKKGSDSNTCNEKVLSLVYTLVAEMMMHQITENSQGASFVSAPFIQQSLPLTMVRYLIEGGVKEATYRLVS